MIQYKLIEVDNPNTYGQKCLGHIGPVIYNGIIFLFSHMQSSIVQEYKKVDDKLIIQTKNTKYTFQEQK